MKKAMALILAVTILCFSGCTKGSENTDTSETSLSNNTSVADETSATTEQSLQTEATIEELQPVNDDDGELVKNGTFDTSSTEPWMTFFQGGVAEISVEDGRLKVDISSAGNVEYSVQIYQDGFRLYNNGKYQLKFDVSSSIPRQIESRIQNGDDYHAYVLSHDNITDEPQTITLDFEMTEETDLAPRLAFNIGIQGEGITSMEPHQIYIDNVSLTLVDDTGVIPLDEGDKGPDINVDQIGYLTNETKLAIFRNKALGTDFKVINADTEECVYTGTLSDVSKNSIADESNAFGDFTEVKTPGKYYITSGDNVKSYVFTIGEDIYRSAYENVIKMLYMQRCGTELPSEYAGDFAHPACHNGKALIYGTDKEIDVTGGWHDAGDYGRYVVPGAKTVADLFIAFELNPQKFSDNTKIPESSNGIPDILDEAKYELDWMLKMQDAETGGVYHKVTCADFPDLDAMPQDETEQLIVSPVSLAATADFAAVMAMSSRIFNSYDKDYSNTCLSAAEKAWSYLESVKGSKSFKNPAGIKTGEYGNSNTADERFWAAAELLKVTDDEKYAEYVKNILIEYSYYTDGLGWASVGDYGVYSFLTYNGNDKDSEAYEKAKSMFIERADKIVSVSNHDGYKTSLISSNYCWGSNMSVANNAMLLILADKIQGGNAEYINTAKEQIHYIFGRNPMSISYVTGTGTVSPVDTHHRPSIAIGKTLPGMLVGGPNANLEDPYAKNVLAEKPPAKCYADKQQAYSLGEITIYWNSPLIVAMDCVTE